MRIHEIPFKTGTKGNLLYVKLNIKDMKKHTPENNHMFRFSLKLLIKILPLYNILQSPTNMKY